MLFDEFNHKEFRVPLTGRLVCNIESNEKLLQRERALHVVRVVVAVGVAAEAKPESDGVATVCAVTIKMLHDSNDRGMPLQVPSLAKTYTRLRMSD